MSDDRPIVYEENGTLVFRASSIGMPVRCLTAAALGYDPLPAPEYLVKAADAGNEYEGIVKGRLRGQGWTITGEQGSVDVPVSDRIVIRGHLDGWHIFPPGPSAELGFEWATLVKPGSDLMLEVKSMSDRVFKKWLSQGFAGFDTYAWQISAYMQATGRPALYVVVNRDDDEVFDFRVVEEPPVPWQQIRQKVLLVDYYRGKRQLPECTGHTYTCPFDYLCDARAMQFEEIEDGSAAMIDRLAAEYDEQRRLLADVKAAQDAVKDQILVALAGRDGVDTGGWRVKLGKVTRRSQDKKALSEYLATQGRKLDEFMAESTHDRLTVTKGDGADG
jgi:hypothetical protein